MQGDEILAEISRTERIKPTNAAPRPVELIPAVRVNGRFMAAGQQKASVRGVTYGPFAETGSGREFGNKSRVLRDFEQMLSANVNAIRTYTVPPLWLLDAAERSGLRVMVGIPWEQHVTFLDDANQTESILRRVR